MRESSGTVQPQIDIISARKDNRYGHPHAEMLARAAEVTASVLRTDELGRIEVVTDGTPMGWWAWRYGDGGYGEW